MPVWCPECNAMLADGTEECPRCGTRIHEHETEEGFSGSDVAWFSAYTIAILLIPIIVGVGIALLCLLLFLGQN
jgi:hypothetical protein